MIRMIPSTSAAHAKAYFSTALSQSDYYINDQELQGKFAGKLADRLGITGSATKEAFFALAENRHPKTGKQLTPHTKSGRITGYDINFHCPKSVSICHVFSGDKNIQTAFENSVRETMADIEKAAATRVRKNKTYADRKTGELVWAEFIHQTSRPAGDDITADPHLHLHAYVMNLTWDETEKKYKAAKFREINRNMPLYQAAFHKRLADYLIQAGYKIRPTKHAFEIEGVPDEVIRHFSKRTDQIGRVAKEKGITDAKALDELGAKTRAKKQKGLSMEDLRQDWHQQLAAILPKNEREHEKEPEPQRIPFIPEPKPLPDRVDAAPNRTAKECLDHAVKHCFERASVVSNKQLLAAATRYALGYRSVSFEDIKTAFEKDNRIIQIQRGSQTLCTTKEVLYEEKRMVDLARRGMGKLSPLYQEAPEFKNVKDQQATAVAHVLTTPNRVSIIRGAAGTGKTTLMKEACEWIKKANKKVITVAPTADAARGVLREEGFEASETVAKLLSDKTMQEQLANQVLWVDEAGLLGTKDMTALLELAQQKNARVILGGDTRQHSAVIRGDALRILSTVGGIRSAEVSKIYRQQKISYREAVEDLSKGDVKQAFDKLEASGAIKTYEPLTLQTKLADDYMAAVKRKKSVLIVSPTHKEGDLVTHEIRDRLRKIGKIGKRQTNVTRFTNLNFTEAEKQDWRNYQPGQMIQFSQNLKYIKRGSVWHIRETKEEGVVIQNKNGFELPLPYDQGKNFDVFEQSAIPLAKGDSVRITRNGFDKDNKRFNNGTMLQVKEISKDNYVILENKKTKTRLKLDPEFGHLNHAYCITSHASQGKTVDEVFIAQPSATFGATDMKQFYVSVSRGKEAVHIYTDDKAELLEHAAEIGDRKSALELLAGKSLSTKEHINYRQKNEYTPIVPKTIKEKKTDFIRNTIDIDYEPEI